MSILDTIVAHKRTEIEARKIVTPLHLLEARLPDAPPVRDFSRALCDPARPSPRVITEVKRRSPSRGVLRHELDATALARMYEANGAAAVSVLTDARFFGGSLDDLREVRAAVGLPLLCKEFIVDPYQVCEARLAGADAILLIAAILSSTQLRELMALGTGLGMDTLVEVHDQAELDVALDSGARIVGINNRDLRTFSISLETTYELRPMIPPGIATVSESGIAGPEDRTSMAGIGIDALLIGESLLTAPDPALATRSMCGVGAASLEGSIL